MAANVKNNGHKPVPDSIKTFLDSDSFGGAFSTQQMSSAIEKLVDPGENPRDLIMRANYWDFDYKTAWMYLLFLGNHFDDPEFKELLMNVAAGDPAVGGLRIDQMVQCVIGKLDPQRKVSLMDRGRNFLGMGKDKDEAQS